MQYVNFRESRLNKNVAKLDILLSKGLYQYIKYVECGTWANGEYDYIEITWRTGNLIIPLNKTDSLLYYNKIADTNLLEYRNCWYYNFPLVDRYSEDVNGVVSLIRKGAPLATTKQLRKATDLYYIIKQSYETSSELLAKLKENGFNYISNNILELFDKTHEYFVRTTGIRLIGGKIVNTINGISIKRTDISSSDLKSPDLKDIALLL